MPRAGHDGRPALYPYPNICWQARLARECTPFREGSAPREVCGACALGGLSRRCASERTAWGRSPGALICRSRAVPPATGQKGPGAYSHRLYDDAELFDMQDPQTRRLLALHSLPSGEALRLRILGREGVISAIVDDDFATPAVSREAAEEVRRQLRLETARLATGRPK